MPPIKSPYPPYNYDYFIEGQINTSMPPQVKGFPERAAWCKAFTDKVQELATGRELTGWHELGSDSWQLCADHANSQDLNAAKIVGVKLEPNRNILGEYQWYRPMEM